MQIKIILLRVDVLVNIVVIDPLKFIGFNYKTDLRNDIK